MQIYGSADFRRLTGAGNVAVRLMEAHNVISPARTQSGWRVFTQDDVTAATAWLAENAKPRQQRA